MPPTIKQKPQILSELISGFAVEMGIEPNLTSGDPLLALAESDTLQVMFLQWLAQQVLKFARASTATGEDLDSWLYDFGFYRNPPTKARGQVRFSMRSPKSTAVTVPAGKIVQVSGGGIQFVVIGDTLQTAWDATQNAYVFQPGQTSIIASVQALTAGAASNVLTGKIVQIASTLPGVDLVTNLAPVIGGQDAEVDQNARDRFKLWINSRARNTEPAITEALLAIPEITDFSLVENVDQNGSERNGCFLAVIDDGSGSPSVALQNTAANALEAVRGYTIESIVRAPVRVDVTATLNVKVATGADSDIVTGKVHDAIVDYINGLRIGQTLYVYKLIQVAFEADAGVVAVQSNSVKVNGSEVDVTATVYNIIRTDTTDVTVGTFV